MYFVDRKQIEDTLLYMESNIDLFNETTDWSERFSQLALERIAHGIIESIIDVGNAMIDGFIMRDPGSYEDIVDILDDENVITASEKTMIKQVVACRHELVRSYIHVNVDQLQKVLRENIAALQSFPTQIRRYLTEELGPVSAFLPEDSKGD